MLVLGVSGGLEPIHGSRLLRRQEGHDAAAVLLDDGQVAWAIEEERLTRVKHTNAMPLEAIRRCLRNHGRALRDLDALAIYGREDLLDAICRRHTAANPAQAAPDIRTLIHRTLREEFDDDIPDGRLCFVHHHLCHAMSAFVPSGFEQSLIVTIDGYGDELSGMVLTGRENRVKVLRELGPQKSLGNFYVHTVRYLGFSDFDEYKVMGLAPYGDVSIARDAFVRMYSLLPHGDYELHWDRINDIAADLGPPRQPDAPITQHQMDVAAALQEALEAIIVHLVRYYHDTTGHQHLCLAGGVAQNCSANGKLSALQLFKSVFVQPASYDAGCALGAAWHSYFSQQPAAPRPTRLREVFWGSELGDTDAVARRLEQWNGLLSFECLRDPAAAGARLLADGRILGWAQGRSEFGPRALGNRSIVADPRPAQNKDIVNAVVKKREAFRPFAPAVLEEDARMYFALHECEPAYAFMTFVVDVLPEYRSLLGAVTHVDGTARVQVVSREVNPRFWYLIQQFKALTDLPILLNTSFNNNVEPIVDSVDDVVTCVLTTGLEQAIVGDFLVSKLPGWHTQLSGMHLTVPAHVTLEDRVGPRTRQGTRHACSIGTSDRRRNISPAAFALIKAAAIEQPPSTSVAATLPPSEVLLAELVELWRQRLVMFLPAGDRVSGGGLQVRFSHI